MRALNLDDLVLQSFEIGAVFTEQFQSRINSFALHRKEDFLVTAGDDDCLQIFDTAKAKHLKTVSSRKYGCRHVTYTHHVNAVLTASALGANQDVRYLSLHDNCPERWLRYFHGHSRTVTSLAMSPSSDLFLSSGEDQEVRLWDLRSPDCEGLLKCPGLPSVATDQQGLVFSVSSDCGVIKLFDVRGYDKGPFITFAIKDENCSEVPFSSIKFSYDGQKILAVNEGTVYVLEAFQGHVMMKVNVGTPEGGIPLEASFTPDGRYVTSGCYDGKIRIWKVDHKAVEDPSAPPSPQEFHIFDGHTDLPACVKWSPRKSLMVSACNSLALWIPNLESIKKQTEFGLASEPESREEGANGIKDLMEL